MSELQNTIALGFRLMAKNVYDVEECAAFLGKSETTIRHMVADKRIPYYKVGSSIRFDKHELEREMLAGVRIASESEIIKKARAWKSK